jgi:hypothetical protein
MRSFPGITIGTLQTTEEEGEEGEGKEEEEEEELKKMEEGEEASLSITRPNRPILQKATKRRSLSEGEGMAIRDPSSL